MIAHYFLLFCSPTSSRNNFLQNWPMQYQKMMKYSFCSNSYRYVGTNLLSKTSISEEKSILPLKSGRLTILKICIPHMIMKFCKLAKRPKSKVIPSDLAILRKTLNCKIIFAMIMNFCTIFSIPCVSFSCMIVH